MPWWRRERTPGAEPRVEMLSRPGCHLCDQMLAVAREQVDEVRVRDIDAERAAGDMDQQEHDRWSTEVPVLIVDGEPVARWRIEPGELRLALSRGRRRGSGR